MYLNIEKNETLKQIYEMGFKKLILTTIIGLTATLCMAQFSPNRNEFWNNVRFGGGLGLGFTNNGFNASVSPTAIYQFNNQIATGASLNLNYAKFGDNKFLAYGGSILTLYNPLPQIQLSTEFEQLRINRTLSTQAGNIEDNYWLPGLFLGVGYSTSNVTFGLRYDVLFNDTKSIYGNALMPFMRVFF